MTNIANKAKSFLFLCIADSFGFLTCTCRSNERAKLNESNGRSKVRNLCGVRASHDKSPGKRHVRLPGCSRKTQEFWNLKLAGRKFQRVSKEIPSFFMRSRSVERLRPRRSTAPLGRATTHLEFGSLEVPYTATVTDVSVRVTGRYIVSRSIGN